MYRGKMERKTIVIGLGRIFGDPFGCFVTITLLFSK
jgi:hypothetical protein